MKQTVVSAPVPQRSPWVVNNLMAVDGIEMVELKRGDKQMQKWLIGKTTYNAKVSAVITELLELQRAASLLALGQDLGSTAAQKTQWRALAEAKALRKLAGSSNLKLVQVDLPSFTFNGNYVPSVATTMPLGIKEHSAIVPLKTAVLTWVYMRCQVMPQPETRHADKAPLEKGITWHKRKKRFVAKGVDGLKYKTMKCSGDCEISGGEENSGGSRDVPSQV